MAPGRQDNKPAYAPQRLLPSLSAGGTVQTQTRGSAGFLLSAHQTLSPLNLGDAVWLLHPQGAQASSPHSPGSPGAPVPKLTWGYQGEEEVERQQQQVQHLHGGWAGEAGGGAAPWRLS